MIGELTEAGAGAGVGVGIDESRLAGLALGGVGGVGGNGADQSKVAAASGVDGSGGIATGAAGVGLDGVALLHSLTCPGCVIVLAGVKSGAGTGLETGALVFQGETSAVAVAGLFQGELALLGNAGGNGGKGGKPALASDLGGTLGSLAEPGTTGVCISHGNGCNGSLTGALLLGGVAAAGAESGAEAGVATD